MRNEQRLMPIKVTAKESFKDLIRLTVAQLSDLLGWNKI
jgi:hypothetical protein